MSKLCQTLLPTDTIQSIKFFTANVSARPHDPHLPVRQQIYFRALKTIPDLTMIYGHFLTHSVRMILTGSDPIQRVWVDKTEEKGSDVNFAAHLLHDGFKGLSSNSKCHTTGPNGDTSRNGPVRTLESDTTLDSFTSHVSSRRPSRWLAVLDTTY